jgi:hypothetical protein
MTFKTFVKKIDFPRLRKQKELLHSLRLKLFAADSDSPEARQIEELYGVADLLDDLMDAAAEVLSEKRVFGKSGNTNGLARIKCPKCGYEEHFYITAESEFVVHDDGTDDHSDVEWDGMSWVRCGDGACGHTGQLWEFQA